MKVEIVKNYSGPAWGKQYMKFTDDRGELIGYIQPTNLEVYALGGTTAFITYNYRTCKWGLSSTPWDAVQEIFGVSGMEETDRIFDSIYEQISGGDFYKECWKQYL